MPAELAPTAQASPSAQPVPIRRRWSPLAFVVHPFFAPLVFVAVTLAVYAPSLDGELLWDDHPLIRGNALIRSPLFVLEVFRHTLFEGVSNFYRPAQSLTYLWDYYWWGSEPFGYHLTNALIHAGNGFLLFTLLRRILPALLPPVTRRPATDRGAFALALLWVAHPVHSAAVSYISGRADSLAMAFCLGAWLLCERLFDATRPFARIAWGAGAFACFLLGLCSKEIAFVWLVLFTGWLFLARSDASRQRWQRLAVVAGGLLAIGCYLALRQIPPPPPPPPVPVAVAMPPKAVLMLRALGDYGRLMIFPDRLFMERQVFAAPGLANPAEPSYYLALAVLGGFTLAAFAIGAWRPGRGQRLRRAGAGWFLVGFLPVSNLFALNASVAEHWLYLPSIGFLLFLAGVALDVPWTRLLPTAARTRGVAATVVVVGLAAAALGVRTWLRAHDWADQVTFYRQTIRDGGDFPRAREGLALALADAHPPDLAAAIALLTDLAARYPDDFSARVNLATFQLRSGRADEARAALRQIAADLLVTHSRRAGPREFAVTIQTLDRLETPGDPAWNERRRALLDLSTAHFPESWELLQIRLADAENAGNPTAALALAQNFAASHWWHAASHLAVGRLLARLDRTDEAIDAWKQAARLDVYGADAPASAAALCLAKGRLDESLTWQRTAVRRQPASPRQHLFLAQVLERAGHPDEAARERDLAAHLAEPDHG